MAPVATGVAVLTNDSRIRAILRASTAVDRVAISGFLATFDDQATRRAVAATAWNNGLAEGQINRLRTKTPDVGQGQITLLDQRLLPAA